MPDPGSGIFLTLDPGSGMEKFGFGITSRIRKTTVKYCEVFAMPVSTKT
jgi:hypothetical protein